MIKTIMSLFMALLTIVAITRAGPVRAEAKSDILAPALSLFLPGLDQWWEGEYRAAAAYTGIWVGGSSLAATAIDSLKRREVESGSEIGTDEGLASRDGDVRRAMLGGQMAFAAGSYSTLHAFQNAADSRRESGQYSFMGEQVTGKAAVLDTVAAPFRVSYLSRSSTYIPLGVIGALAAYSVKSKTPGYVNVALRDTDYAFGAGYSYLAGTHEEALFRGWMMPLIREYVAGDTTSNILQSLIFALAHRGSVDLPIPQLLLGYHLGYVTQRNGWTLGEAAFIHTWWDVIAFMAAYSKRESPAVLNLPPLSLVF